MLVELDVFSGRPNPRWELDEFHSRELLRLQDQLQESSARPPEPPGLGYRGFRYSDARGSVQVHHGYVITAHRVWVDPTFTIEGFLLEQVPPEFAPVCERIRRELVGRK